MYLQLHVFIFFYNLLNPFSDVYMFMNVGPFTNTGNRTITILARLTCQRVSGLSLFLPVPELVIKCVSCLAFTRVLGVRIQV